VSFSERRSTSGEAGLDRHEWESVWASLEDELEDSPDAALSQLADLVRDMLTSRGVALDDPVATSGDEAEIVLAYRNARQTAERAELGEASRGDVGVAIDDLRSIYEAILAERTEP
jgi:hypothetical protein